VLERAAIEAELESGRREETIHKAKVHILWRMARIVAGTFVVVLGVILLALPGPGMVVVALGLGILAQDVPFARRMLERVKARLPQDADGRLPLIVWVMMIGSVVVFTAASVWIALLRL
jgi:uncharacterized protein (TIGR02611 family)